jgi:hypothetical protein
MDVLFCSSNFGKKTLFDNKAYVYHDTVEWKSDMEVYEVTMRGQERKNSEKLLDKFIKGDISISCGAFLNSSGKDINAGGGVMMDKDFIGKLIDARLVQRRGGPNHIGPSVYILTVKPISPAEIDESMLPKEGSHCWMKKGHVVRALGVPCSNLGGDFLPGIFLVHVNNVDPESLQMVSSRLNRE